MHKVFECDSFNWNSGLKSLNEESQNSFTATYQLLLTVLYITSQTRSLSFGNFVVIVIVDDPTVFGLLDEKVDSLFLDEVE